MRGCLLIALLGAIACDARSAQGSTASACTFTAGEHVHSLTVNGVERTYRVLASAQAKIDAPVVLLWHGYGGSAQSVLASLRASSQWPEALVVAPQGLPRTFPQLGLDAERPGWQIQVGELGDRDLQFFDALLADLTRRYCVNRERVFSTGFSNGGFISNLLACERSRDLRAIAPVGGGGPFGARCGTPVPVLLTHGTSDEVVPVHFAHESFGAWQRHNRCEPQAQRDLGTGCHEAVGCAAPATLCLFAGGHRWPDDRTTRVMQFFRAQAR